MSTKNFKRPRSKPVAPVLPEEEQRITSDPTTWELDDPVQGSLLPASENGQPCKFKAASFAVVHIPGEKPRSNLFTILKRGGVEQVHGKLPIVLRRTAAGPKKPGQMATPKIVFVRKLNGEYIHSTLPE